MRGSGGFDHRKGEDCGIIRAVGPRRCCAVDVDVNRELSGLDAITDWAGADIFGAHVHFDVLNVTERQERTIITLKVDGTFDRTGLVSQPRRSPPLAEPTCRPRV